MEFGKQHLPILMVYIYKFATGITEIIAEGAELDEVYYDPTGFERK